MTVGKKSDQPGDEAFLSRWARVKQSTQAAQASEPSIVGDMQNTSIGAPIEHKVAEEAHSEPSLPAALPSVDDLTPQSDFSPFMARDVDPQLRNLAMKKLFTDPHYNVMDRLDTYIDDYSTHLPLPLDVIRQMSISKTLRLFDDDEKEKGKAPVDESAVPVLPLAKVTQAEPLTAVEKMVVEAEQKPTAGVAVKPSQDD